MNRIDLTAAIGYRGYLIHPEIPNETYVVYGHKPDGTAYELGIAAELAEAISWVNRHSDQMQDAFEPFGP